MQGKIGLEEHFAIDDTISDSKGFLPERVWPELRARLLDFHDKRLAEMDKHGMAIMILSLNAPAVGARTTGRRPPRSGSSSSSQQSFSAEQRER